MSRMMGMWEIRVGMIAMWGIRVGMLETGDGMRGIRVGMQGIRVGMRGIRVILCENLHVYCFG